MRETSLESIQETQPEIRREPEPQRLLEPEILRTLVHQQEQVHKPSLEITWVTTHVTSLETTVVGSLETIKELSLVTTQVQPSIPVRPQSKHTRYM